eukprot:CFRG2293T1
MTRTSPPAKVSIITPVYHAVEYLGEALNSVLNQTYRPLELSVFVDGSDDDDGSLAVLNAYKHRLLEVGIEYILTVSGNCTPRGCGYACNQAIKHSTGSFLCFLDADDTMTHDRVEKQLEVCLDQSRWAHGASVGLRGGECASVGANTRARIASPRDIAHSTSVGVGVIVGCNVTRSPDNATPRYTKWINGLKTDELISQRFRECTLIKPTWFTSRTTFYNVGAFSEAGRGTPEDMIFLYKHMDLNGALAKVAEPLVMYRYHKHSQSHGVKWEDIFELRVRHMEKHLLDRLSSFSIWSAGREGKRFYKALKPTNQSKVVCFLDVKATLISGPGYRENKTDAFIPIYHYSILATKTEGARMRPVITCVKIDLHSGFESNLVEAELREGLDCFYFA